MKPIPIPDDLIPEGAARETVGAPRGLEKHISPVEIWRARTSDDTPVQAVLIQLDEDDLKAVNSDPRIWLYFMGTAMVPFNLSPVQEKE